MPRVGVEHHGIERTDAGNLGSGIYFSDAFRSVARVGYSLRYSLSGAAVLMKTLPLQHQFEVLAAQRD